MKKLVLIFTVLLVMLALTSCATVLKGSTQDVTIDSSPSGADVYVDGKAMGKTPAIIPLEKNEYSSIKVEKDGYEPQMQSLETKYDMITLLNAFWDYSTTDLLTGNAFEYAPDAYFFELKESN